MPQDHTPEPTETTSQFEKLLAKLARSGVDFAVVGGLAVVLNGYGRVTEDASTLDGFAVENDGRPIGCALWRVEDGDCELVVIVTTYRGVGAGTALLDAVVVQVAGDVDEHTAPDLAWLLLPCLASAPATVVADFGETDFLGVAGLELLLHARSRARFQDTQLWLAAPSPAVQRALEVSGIKRLFQTTPMISAVLARPEPAAAVHAL